MAKIVFYTGAGVSAESGLPTFRGQGGVWHTFDPEKVASIKAWHRRHLPDCNGRRQAALDFFNPMRRLVLSHEPNEAHRLIAAFEDDYDVTVITQNGDNYHTLAGSSDVVYLHGEALKNCTMARPYEGFPCDPANPDIRIGDLGPDGSQIRPFVIYFDEQIDQRLWRRAVRASRQADYFVVVGSTMLVYPAAELFAKLHPSCKIFVIDPQALQLPKEAEARPYTHIPLPASKGLRALKSML